MYNIFRKTIPTDSLYIHKINVVDKKTKFNVFIFIGKSINKTNGFTK